MLKRYDKSLWLPELNKAKRKGDSSPIIPTATGGENCRSFLRRMMLQRPGSPRPRKTPPWVYVGRCSLQRRLKHFRGTLGEEVFLPDLWPSISSPPCHQWVRVQVPHHGDRVPIPQRSLPAGSCAAQVVQQRSICGLEAKITKGQRLVRKSVAIRGKDVWGKHSCLPAPSTEFRSLLEIRNTKPEILPFNR